MKLIRKAALALAGAALVLGTAVFTACDSNVPPVDDGVEDTGGGNNNSDDIDDPTVNPGGSENPGSSDNPGGSENPGNSGPSTTPSDDEIELDWADDEKYPFITIAAGCESAAGKYKIYIQSPKSGKPALDNIRMSEYEKAEPAIHINVTGDGQMSCSLPEEAYVAKNAIYTLYLSAFTVQETKFTITDNNGKYLCYVYFKDGTGKKSYGTFDDVEEPRDETPPVGDDGNIDWDNPNLNWVGYDGEFSQYADTYKVIVNGKSVDSISNVTLGSIQKPGGLSFVKKPGIYMSFHGVTAPTKSEYNTCCTLEGGADYSNDESEDAHAYAIDGTGFWFYLDNFTEKETEFTVTFNNAPEFKITVYNAKS